jgi:Tfp pilus assembly protein PilF
VKGADEIYSLLWSLFATWLSVNYIRTRQISSLVFIAIAFFLALLSKENALVFALVIPLCCWYFLRKVKPRQIAFVTLSLASGFIIYITLRLSVIGIDISSSPPSEMMNNPFIKYLDGQYLSYSPFEKWSAIITGLAKYIQLLFFPHPLTNDYYPRFFPVENLTAPAVIAAAMMHISLILIALLGIRKRSFVSFIILFFYASIFLVSNILFPIGTHISERFLFTPSISFCLLMAHGWVQIRKKSSVQTVYGSFLIIMFVVFAMKTYDRNQVWKDDFTLFTTDVEVSGQSAKARNAAGGALITRSQEIEEGATRDSMLYAALDHLAVATAIHPRYKGAHLLLGNAHTYLENYYPAVDAYETAVRIDPYYDEAYSNLAIASREAGRYAGSVENDIDKAKEYLFRSIEIDEGSYETLSLLGIAFGNEGSHNMAIAYFESAIEANPDVAHAYVNLGRAYLNAGDEEEAQIQFQKAVAIDPQILNN